MEEKQQPETEDEDLPGPCQETLERISAHRTKPGVTVFVDRENDNAWISSNLEVEPSD